MHRHLPLTGAPVTVSLPDVGEGFVPIFLISRASLVLFASVRAFLHGDFSVVSGCPAAVLGEPGDLVIGDCEHVGDRAIGVYRLLGRDRHGVCWVIQPVGDETPAVGSLAFGTFGFTGFGGADAEVEVCALRQSGGRQRIAESSSRGVRHPGSVQSGAVAG